MTSDQSLRVLIVDDNRDGADALGLLLEELDNQVHVTYGGIRHWTSRRRFVPT
jgi:CheY-like chemotaxis protein